MTTSSHDNDEEKGVTPRLTKSNSKLLGLHRHVSTVMGKYMGDRESTDGIDSDPKAMSVEDQERLIDDVMDGYKDKDGNVLHRQIVRDALLSNMEKFKQKAENSHLTKEVSVSHLCLLPTWCILNSANC